MRPQCPQNQPAMCSTFSSDLGRPRENDVDLADLGGQVGGQSPDRREHLQLRGGATCWGAQRRKCHKS